MELFFVLLLTVLLYYSPFILTNKFLAKMKTLYVLITCTMTSMIKIEMRFYMTKTISIPQ